MFMFPLENLARKELTQTASEVVHMLFIVDKLLGY